MDFQLTTEQSLLKACAREFARQTIAPQAAYYDRAAGFPWEIFREAQQRDLLHLAIPPAYGGKGLGILEQVLVSEEFAWGCTGICAAISLNALAITALLLAGTPAQQCNYLPRLLAGELCSFAMTEPEAGSDIAAIQTTALPGSGDYYLLNGRKTWISNAPEANLFMIFAKTSPTEGHRGISAFLIERTTPGVVVGPPLGKLGQRATPTAEIMLQDVQVPQSALLGSQDHGFGLAMQVFDHSRPLIAAYGVGLTQRCLDEALAYARTRRTMGKPIIEHQAIGQKLAEMGMRLEAARLLTYQAAWLLAASHPNTLQAAYAKAFAADTAMWAASEAVQIFGGAGYSTDLPLEKLLRDAKLLQIYEGTSEIQRVIMTNELTRAPSLSTTEPAPLPVQEHASTAVSPMTPVEQLFEAQVERTPDRVALVFAQEQLTYAALNRRANQLAHHLQGLGVGPGVLVGICMERSVELVIGLLGVFKAGGAYVFLDPTYPRERLAFMLQETQVKLLLTQQRLLDMPGNQHTPAICLDTEWETFEPAPTANVRSGVTQQDLTYVMYTSGSTGRPKGVMIERAGLSNMVQEQIRLFGVQSQHRIAQFAPFSFDASVSEVFMALLAGAQLYLIPQEWRWPIPALLQYVQEHAITTITLPPSVLALLPPEELPILQTIISAGEDLSSEIAARWLPGRAVFNAYGPTETTVCATLGRCREHMGHPPIGFPLANTQVYLLDALLRPVPRGVAAQVYIGGIGPARGYLNRPDLTAETFLPDPFSSRPGARLYKTGDLARSLPDGSLEYLGRIDHQVKLRGQRIELGEIEAALLRHPAIRECAVLVREEANGDKRLLAYIVCQESAAPSSQDLRAFLRKTLPDYMLPAAFVPVDSLPLTPHGKLDRRALLSLATSPLEDAKPFVAPGTSLEEELAGILQKLLGVPQVGRSDPFITLGGDSLLLTQLLAGIQERFHVTLAPRSVYDFPTIATLAQHIERCQQEAGEQPGHALLPISREGPLPLSFSQQRLWFLDHLNPQSTTYGIYGVFQLEGHLHVAVLERSLQEIVRRHETLRTTIVEQDGQPILSLLPDLRITLTPISLQHLPPEEQAPAVQQHVLQELQRPFDLARGPLLRFTLLRLEKDKHIFMVSIHHIIADGWSMGILYRELAALYEAFGRGEPSPLPDLPVQFVDFVAWQHRRFQGKVLERELAYWKQQLHGIPALLELPTDRPRPAVQTDHGAHYTFLFPPALLQRLKALSQQEQATLFMTLLAALKVLLYRYTGQEDLVVSTAIASRTSKAIEPLIGFFADTLALRTVLRGSLSFRELLRRVREVTLEAYTHQDIRFEQLIDALQFERNLSYSPLVQVMFNVQSQQMFTLELSGLTVNPVPFESGTSKADLTLVVVETAAGLSGSLEYNTDLFEESTIARMVTHWRNILEGIVANPEQQIARLPLLSTTEQTQLIVQWNATAADYPKTTLPQLLEAQVERSPDSIALIFEEEQLTYSELNRRANQLAHHLRGLGVGPEMLVGICIERSLEMVIGLLAILKAGGAYVPLDPTLPSERLAFMLQDTQLQVVLGEQRLLERLPDHQARTLCLESAWQAVAQESEDNVVIGIQGNNLAYVLYTSGSTGRPKGVQVLQQGVVNFLFAMQHHVQMQAGERLPAITTISFDIAGLELFLPLMTGGTCVLVGKAESSDGWALSQLLQRQGITLMQGTPATWSLLLAAGWQGNPRLRLLCGGEALPLALARRVVNKSKQMWNVYGPTETTIWSSLWQVEPTAERVVIGRPIANTQIYLLDEGLQPVPVGVRGELYIGGVGVARGYLGRPGLTAERFVPDPFSREPGAQLYRTGDLAYYHEDGTIEYVGRRDHQVKVRGYRIELGEIEAVLREQPAVREAVVLLREDQPGEQRLVAYVVAQPGQELQMAQLRQCLQQRLPEYMLPASFVSLQALPLTPNGKLDRRALPIPDRSRAELLTPFQEPRTALERTLATIWANVLGLDRVGIHDNFFAIGGDSFTSLRVTTLASESGIRVTPRQMLQYQTISQLAENTSLIAQAPGGKSLAGPLPLLPTQAYYLMSAPDEAPHIFNTAWLAETHQPLEDHLLTEATRVILDYHDALRSRFTQTANGWQATIVEVEETIPFSHIDLSQLDPAEQIRFIKGKMEELHGTLNLSNGPLLRIVYFTLGEQRPGRLLFIVHHFATDAFSQAILVEDFVTAYDCLSRGEPVQLPPKTSSIRDYAERIARYAQSEAMQEIDYWVTPERLQAPALPLDYPEGRQAILVEEYIEMHIAQEKVKAVLSLPGTTLNALILAALYTTYKRWTGQEIMLVNCHHHGRAVDFEDINLSRTVGYISLVVPMLIHVAASAHGSAVVSAIEKLLQQVPNHGVGYNALRYLGTPDVRQLFDSLPWPELHLNYVGRQPDRHQKVSWIKPAAWSEHGKGWRSARRREPLGIFLTAIIGQEGLQLQWNYHQKMFRRETIEKIAHMYLRELMSLVGFLPGTLE